MCRDYIPAVLNKDDEIVHPLSKDREKGDYLSSTFLTSIITGTTTADTLLQNILPITIAGAVVLAIVMISFKAS